MLAEITYRNSQENWSGVLLALLVLGFLLGGWLLLRIMLH